MYGCRICRFDVPLDDVRIPLREGRCICLRCYLRETNTAKPMPPELRRWVEAAMTA